MRYPDQQFECIEKDKEREREKTHTTEGQSVPLSLTLIRSDQRTNERQMRTWSRWTWTRRRKKTSSSNTTLLLRPVSLLEALVDSEWEFGAIIIWWEIGSNSFSRMTDFCWCHIFSPASKASRDRAAILTPPSNSSLILQSTYMVNTLLLRFQRTRVLQAKNWKCHWE